MPVVNDDESNPTDLSNLGLLGFPEPPSRCFELDGLLGDLFHLVLGASRYPQKPFALAAAISVISVAAGSRFRLTSGTRPNLYSVLVGPSGCGKEEPVRAVKKILDIAGLGAKMVADNIASGAGLEDRVADSPACLIFIDEFGLLLAKVLSSPGGDNGVFRALTELYSKNGTIYRGRALAGRKAVEIRNPTVSVLASTTAESLFDAVDLAGAESGILSRYFFLPTNDPRPFRQEPQPIEALPDCISDGLVCLAEEGPDVLVDIEEDAHTCFREYLDFTDERLRRGKLEPIVRASFVRRGETVARLMITGALSRSPIKPVISLNDVEWATALTSWSYRSVFYQLKEAVEANAGNKDYKRLIQFVKNAPSYAGAKRFEKFSAALSEGCITKRILQQKMKVDAKTFAGLLASAIEAGEIELVTFHEEHELFHGYKGSYYRIPID